MNSDPMKEIQLDPIDALVSEDLDEEFDTVGDYHRQAAHHFAEAAKHHLLAAEADDEGDEPALEMHAYRAYRHQLNAIQYAEIAVMESEPVSDETD